MQSLVKCSCYILPCLLCLTSRWQEVAVNYWRMECQHPQTLPTEQPFMESPWFNPTKSSTDVERSVPSESLSEVDRSSLLCADVCCSNALLPYPPAYQYGCFEGLSQELAHACWHMVFSVPWLVMCVARSKVFCQYCQYCTKHGLISISKNTNPAFETCHRKGLL